MRREPIDWISRGPRKPARLTASAHWPDGTTSTVDVTQMSYLGCRLACDRALMKGQSVKLFLPDLGQVHAQIRWVRGGIAGAKFLTGDSAKDARRARLGV
jgi:hypothetical protein